MKLTFRTATIGALLVSALLAMHPARAWFWDFGYFGRQSYTATRYPIVLAHGMGGFRSLFGVIDYFHGITASLESGGARVYVTQVPQFSSTERRGEALLAQVQEIVAISGRGKVNLIGHSHGGLDVRYVASVAPSLVASVTTIGSPHGGAELADFMRANFRNGSFGELVISTFTNSLGSVLALLSGTGQVNQNSIATLDSLTTAGAAAFNARHPAAVPRYRCGHGQFIVNGVRYYSWSGSQAFTNIFDPSDPLMALTGSLYREANDGLVGRCSSHLGWVIRDNYRMNHLDEVNQLFGLTHLLGPDAKRLYRTHANRLKNQGL